MHEQTFIGSLRPQPAGLTGAVSVFLNTKDRIAFHVLCVVSE